MSFCLFLAVNKLPSLEIFPHLLLGILRRRRQTPRSWLAVTCGEETVRRQEKLGRNLHLHLVLGQLEDGEVLLLPLVVRNAAL